MFEVLVFVYENYWRGDACPELDRLERKLHAAGFDTEEVQCALCWLNDLNLAAQETQNTQFPPLAQAEADAMNAVELPLVPSATSMRVYSVAEQNHLGSECLGFISFLDSAGVLPVNMRELVLDRAMATGEDSVTLDDLKIIILMVYWSFGQEPDSLILDELCDDAATRLAH